MARWKCSARMTTNAGMHRPRTKKRIAAAIDNVDVASKSNKKRKRISLGCSKEMPIELSSDDEEPDSASKSPAAARSCGVAGTVAEDARALADGRPQIVARAAPCHAFSASTAATVEVEAATKL